MTRWSTGDFEEQQRQRSATAAPRPVPRSLVAGTLGLAAAAVLLLEVGLARELLHERGALWAFVAATAVTLLVAVAAVRELLARLRRTGETDERLPPGRTRPVLAPSLAAFVAAGGFAGYDAWVDWLMTAVVGALVSLLLAPALYAWLRQ